MNAALPAPNKIAPRKKSTTLWWILGLGLLLVGLGAAAYFKNKQGGQTVTVTTEKAVTKTITQLVSATGKVQPEVEVKIAPEVSGEIVKLPFREGAVVKKDDHLMDATRYFIVSGLPLCLVAPDAGRRLARGDDGQSNHQSDYDPFEEL